ncbi:hypothetical protein [Mycobacterium lepromatosis]|uniref:hypothetical protein n=1 Tax=Mycobacterium lepromatosis TaxID=480418 RepID=UPI000A550EAB|nr:hypothetical protein [Mycobacterium lepromatosis]
MTITDKNPVRGPHPSKALTFELVRPFTHDGQPAEASNNMSNSAANEQNRVQLRLEQTALHTVVNSIPASAAWQRIGSSTQAPPPPRKFRS